jgi:hypothetical protein
MKIKLTNGLQVEIARTSSKQILRLMHPDRSSETKWFLSNLRGGGPFRAMVMFGNERIHLIYLLSGFPNAKQWLKTNLQQRLKETLEYPTAIIYKKTCYTYLKNLHILLGNPRLVEDPVSTTYDILCHAVQTGVPPRIIALLNKRQ